MPRPHLLYLAFFFPPSRASGVYRALATTRAFHDAGLNVTVITTTNRFFSEEIGSVDASLLGLIPEGVRVERVPFTFRRTMPEDLREMGWLRGNFPLVWLELRKRLPWLMITALDVIQGRSARSYPMDDRYLTWIEPVVAAARRIAKNSPFHHVLATGNPYSSFEAARVIAALHNVPYTVDYRDPWAFDTRTGSLAQLSPATFAAEERIVREAHACIQVNEAIAEAYRARYPETAHKQWVVVNGYDPDSIPPPRKEYRGGPLQFGILGTVTDLWPLGPLFEAWHRVRPHLPEGSLLRLGGHLGYFPWSGDPLVSTFPDRDAGFIYEGPVSKSEVSRFYSQLDVVVVPLFGGPMLTAGKVLEAAALGIPIVCIQQESGGARRLLANHRLAFLADPNSDQVAEAMLGAAEKAKSITGSEREAVREEMGVYARETAMSRLVEVVSTGLGEGSSDSKELVKAPGR